MAGYVPNIIHDDVITVMIDSAPRYFRQSHPYFDDIKKAIQKKDWDKLLSYCKNTTMDKVKDFTRGLVEVNNGVLTYKGHHIESALANKIIMMMNENHDAMALVAFLENLYDNPSYRAVQELYGFIQAVGLPITEDGCFLAYKKVRNNYHDIYSGKFDNSIGRTVSMPRYMVDEDKDRTCSVGLHFCSFEYLSQYSTTDDDRVIIVKINPRDVVAIPSDYNNTKGRTCRYEVIGEHKEYRNNSTDNKPRWDPKRDTVVLSPKNSADLSADLQEVEDRIRQYIDDYLEDADSCDNVDDFHDELSNDLYKLKTREIQQIFNDLYYPRGKFSTKTEGVRAVLREFHKAIDD